ncbi:terminase small subunit [Candidatus Pacearchaeota archaeon]|nr:terminase small subunit [Candidatus Pacearchaeota archaeon]
MDKEKFEKFITDPTALFRIVDEVANGGSLIKFCKKESLRYSNVINWIYADEGRQKSYEVGLEARGEYVAQKILAELDRCGFPDIRKLYNEDGSIKKVSDLDDDTAAVIAGIEIQEEVLGKADSSGEKPVIVPRTRKIKIVDKLKAIDMYGRHLKMFTDKIEHSGKVSLEDLVNASMKKPEKEEIPDGKTEAQPQEAKAEETDDGI